MIRADHYLGVAMEAVESAGALLTERFRSKDLEVRSKEDGTPVSDADLEVEVTVRRLLGRGTPELGILGEEGGAEGDTRDRWILDPIDGTESFLSGDPRFAFLLALELDGRTELGVVHAPCIGGLAHRNRCGVPGRTWLAQRGRGSFTFSGTEVPRGGGQRLEVSWPRDLEEATLTMGSARYFFREGLWPSLGELAGTVARTRGDGDWFGHILVAEGRVDLMVDPRVALYDVAPVSLLVEEAGGVFIAGSSAALTPEGFGPVLSGTGPIAKEAARRLGFRTESKQIEGHRSSKHEQQARRPQPPRLSGQRIREADGESFRRR